MCLSAFYKLHKDLTVSQPPRKFCAVWKLQFAGFFHLWNALLSTNFGSTGRLHYFSAVHKVGAHASYMGVRDHLSSGHIFPCMKSFSFAILSILLVSCYSHCELVTEVKEDQFNGRVTTKKIETWNKNTKVLITSDMNFFDAGIYVRNEISGFWDYVVIGDSVSKPRNSYEITVIRDKELRTFNLNYPYCPEQMKFRNEPTN